MRSFIFSVVTRKTCTWTYCGDRQPKSMHARPIQDVHATSTSLRAPRRHPYKHALFPLRRTRCNSFQLRCRRFVRLQLLSYYCTYALILLYVCCDSLQLGCLRCFTTLLLRRSRATAPTPFARATSALTVLRWHRGSRTTGGTQRHTRTHAQTHTLRPRALVSEGLI